MIKLFTDQSEVGALPAGWKVSRNTQYEDVNTETIEIPQCARFLQLKFHNPHFNSMFC